MIYAVGLGRSGTTSIARQLKGKHEPSPKLRLAAVKWHLEGESPISLLKQRAGINTKLISDGQQSLVVDLLRVLDPQAWFIWMVRDFDTWLKSVMTREAFFTEDESIEDRIYEQFPDDWTREDKYSWVYIYYNTHLWEALKGANFIICRTEDLIEHQNKSVLPQV